MSQFYIAAAHKSSGKTSLSIGLAAALKSMGNRVQTFKKGPDYIDPLWLAAASNQPCYNLDFNTHSNDELSSLFTTKCEGLVPADVAIIEGNKGLYDGLDLQGSDCNAAMAKLLNVPVILTIDTIGITRGIAPLLQGYQNFDPDINIAGVILNKVGTSRHQSKLVAAIEHYTDIQVLGAIGYDRSLEIPERHLGLMPANENADAQKVISRLAKAVSEGVNLEKLLALTLSKQLQTSHSNKSDKTASTDVRIAIAKDAAFSFYYADDLEAFEKSGAVLVPFDTLHDQRLPDVDALFIGGGFPETQMASLSANHTLMTDIKEAIEKGMPAYAECGGLMYLANDISWNNDNYKMVGVIPGNINLHKKPQGRGYTKLDITPSMPWSISTNQLTSIAAHEFHYASLDNLPVGQHYAFDVKRGSGITGTKDGIVINNLLANFSHQRQSSSNNWVDQFVTFVRNNKND